MDCIHSPENLAAVRHFKTPLACSDARSLVGASHFCSLITCAAHEYLFPMIERGCWLRMRTHTNLPSKLLRRVQPAAHSSALLHSQTRKAQTQQLVALASWGSTAFRRASC
eukprot:6191809-Pleurochrysis_carterae.AAC.1